MRLTCSNHHKASSLDLGVAYAYFLNKLVAFQAQDVSGWAARKGCRPRSTID